VTIEVEYYDNTGNTVLGLQYDSTSSARQPGHTASAITTTGSNTWRTVRFEIADAFFGGRQNGGADFRLNLRRQKTQREPRLGAPARRQGLSVHLDQRHRRPGAQLVPKRQLARRHRRQSDPTSIVRFLPDQTMNGGTVPITNNLGSQVFNRLQFGGTASSSATPPSLSAGMP
jgi:hypothetical protein